MSQTHWGLTAAEWITVVAIIVGPLLAVATQLWVQARKAKRDPKLWVFSTLMQNRGTWLNPHFAQAINLVDVVFYHNGEVRDKRKEVMDVLSKAPDRNLTPIEMDVARDKLAEMMTKMGQELGFRFDHTEIKNTAYFPRGIQNMETEMNNLRQKALDVLSGKADIGMIVRNLPVQPPSIQAGPTPHFR